MLKEAHYSFRSLFMTLDLVCSGTHVPHQYNVRIAPPHQENLVDPHPGQTTHKSLSTGFAHASLAETPTNSLRVSQPNVFPGLLRHAHAVEYWAKKCCRRVRYINAAEALTAHVSNAELKLKSDIYVIGCTSQFSGCPVSPSYLPPPEHSVGRG